MPCLTALSPSRSSPANEKATFHTPVNLEVYQDYTNFIVHPMDLYKIEQYVKTRKYSSTEAFLSDMKWIHHNCKSIALVSIEATLFLVPCLIALSPSRSSPANEKATSSIQPPMR